SPVFQVVLVLQNAPLPALALGDLRMEQVAMPVTTAKFDLMVMLRETGEEVTGVVEYATDLFAPDTVARLAAHYTTLLERIVDGPDRHVGELELMPAGERDRLLRDWALGERAAWPWTTIPELVATQAAAHPDTVAVHPADPAGGHGLTFGELAARANQIARYLHGLGVGRAARVGVGLDRPPETVVLLLGIIAAGAAYVPLDPGYPAARLALMSTDAALDLLIPGDGDGDRPGPGSGGSLTMRELWEGCAGLPVTAPAVPAEPQDALYCIYTSGSTGRPKGVVGLAGGMLNRLRWMWQRFPFEPGEVLCQKTSLSFLDSFWEIFGPLCQGVPVVVVPDEVVLDPAALVETLARHEVSRLVLVPSLLRALLDTCPDLADRLPRLRLWVTSGEALPVDLARRF